MFDRPFKALYCERYACDPDRFSATVFRRCLYRHALPVALLLGELRAPIFAEDRRAIEQFGIAHTLEQVRSILGDLAYVNRTNRHWLRTGLSIRISGRRLYALAERLSRGD
jgi:hypothetical protein